ncbi:hypothetical protein QBC46DRAFT_150231 [Diplogelasinospora grovesii]|uniref:Phosphoglycerate mutase family protein n=1 Tax=Diplogelasinospora grovesii TaxID=303347 RepID=A0AAN6N6N7_9PEZI|nr:hypothetical protein QBC46DRAFT_150231 [Diplogelasinospora grovesii]
MAPVIYMIRHGEKDPKLPDGKDPDGLSAQGVQRSQYLPHVFGKDSGYDIGYILAEHPKGDGGRERPCDTVKPLAASLGLAIDDRFDRDDNVGPANAARAWSGPGNVLICWEHGQLAGIAEAIGVKKFAKGTGVKDRDEIKYPGDRFDLIWVVPEPYDEITEVRSEDVPGLDDGHGKGGDGGDDDGDGKQKKHKKHDDDD